MRLADSLAHRLPLEEAPKVLNRSKGRDPAVKNSQLGVILIRGLLIAQNSRRNRFVFRPFHWVLLLLMICAVWIGFLRIVLIIPTPADVDYEHSYFSPLPATLFVPFFRLNARLLGWHPWMQENKFRMSFQSGGNHSVPEDGCVSFSGMYLKLAPGLLWGTYVHWDVRQVTICGHPG
jgi:hypothetical protein